MKLHIKKGATVQVTSGQEKGKKGEVLALNLKNPKNILVQIQGVKLQTHFDKKDGMKQKEGFISYSNVKLLSEPTAKGKKTKTAKKAASKTA